MAKDKERKLAYEMYVRQGKTAKEIAVFLEVQEKTVGKWVAQNGWKALREAQVNSSINGRETLKQVISNLAERRLELDAERKQAAKDGDKAEVYRLDAEAASLADQVSKMNVALRAMDTANRITATLYLEIMQDVFSALRMADEKLHNQTLDFQESHAQFICKKLG